MEIRYEPVVVGVAPRVSIVAPYECKDTIKAAMARWEPKRKMWTVAFTPLGLWRVKNALTVAFPEATHTLDRSVEELDGRSMRADKIPLGKFDRSKLTPWTHQRQGSSMIGELAGVMLDWDMGAGKTFAVLNAVVEYGLQFTLIACPSTVVNVWERETKKHLPDDFAYRMLALREGSVAQRGDQVVKAFDECRALQMPLIVAVNYEAIWRAGFGNKIEQLPWDLAVADESQRIGNAFSKVGKFMGKRLGPNAKHKVCLSGTPMGNGAQDLFGQLLFCEPALFGESFTRFRSRYCVMGGFEGRQIVEQQNTSELSKKLSIISTRVVLSDVVDLPPFTDTDIVVHLGAYGRRVYEDLKDNLIAECKEGTVTAANAITKLLRLQQVTSGYSMVEDESTGDTRPVETGTEKAEALLELFNSAKKTEPFVVFCRFTHDVQAVRRMAALAERKCWEISGAAKDQEAWEYDCKHGEGAVIAVQIQAGGLGIDLTPARYCVYYSIGFSLNDYAQSRARVYRPGQERSVFYYHLVASGTVDRVVYQALKKKKNVVDSVLDGIIKAHI